MTSDDRAVEFERPVGRGGNSYLDAGRVGVRIGTSTAYAALGAARIVRDLGDPRLEVAVTGEVDADIDGANRASFHAVRKVRSYVGKAIAFTSSETGRTRVRIGLFASPTERFFVDLDALELEDAAVAAGLIDDEDRHLSPGDA